MRWIILLAILAVVAAGLGWFYVRSTDEKIEVIIDKEEVIRDTEEAVEKGRQVIDEADEEVEGPNAQDVSEPPSEAERREDAADSPVNPATEGVTP